MNVPGFSLTLPAAALLLALSSTAGSLGCSNTSSHGDGVGGASAGSGGSGGAKGAAGATGAGGGAGGRGGTTDAGADLRADGRADARADASGAGGTFVIVDGSGTNYTCAQLLACCNSVTDAQAKSLCLTEYNTVSPGGDSSCNGILATIKRNGGCP